MNSLTKQEQETIIIYNEDDDTAIVFVSNKKTIKKLTQLCNKYPDEYEIENDKDYDKYGCKTFIIPKTSVKITPKSKKSFSKESREKFSQNMKKINSNKNNDTNIV